MKDKITDAATVVLIRDGLQRWSVDRVAAEAGCAKGLIPYHHGSKKSLLAEVAATLQRQRQRRRLLALQSSGAEALDRLWQSLVDEVRSGEWAALAALSTEPGIPTPLDETAELSALGLAVGTALELPQLPTDGARLAGAALTGFQAALHAGAPEDAVREAYHRLWLAFLP